MQDRIRLFERANELVEEYEAKGLSHNLNKGVSELYHNYITLNKAEMKQLDYAVGL